MECSDCIVNDVKGAKPIAETGQQDLDRVKVPRSRFQCVPKDENKHTKSCEVTGRKLCMIQAQIRMCGQQKGENHRSMLVKVAYCDPDIS